VEDVKQPETAHQGGRTGKREGAWHREGKTFYPEQEGQKKGEQGTLLKENVIPGK